MRLLFLFPAVALVAWAMPSRAAPLTETYTFTLGNFSCTPSSQLNDCPAGPPPPVNGSFTVTFDPVMSYTDDTTDIMVKAFGGASVASAFGFTYNPTSVNSDGAKLLSFGGIENGADLAAQGTADIKVTLDVSNPTAPVLFSCGNYSFCGAQSGNGNVLVSRETVTNSANYTYVALADGSSVSAVAGSGSGTTVPEPATLACLASGLAALGLTRRRKA